MRRTWFLVLATLSACSSAAPRAENVDPIIPAPSVSVTIKPTEAWLDACGRQAFTAEVANATDPGVLWEVTEPSGGSAVGGAYVAPPMAGVFHVVARSSADPTRSAQATVTVGPERVVAIAVNPPASTLTPDEVATFTATLTTSCGTVVSR